MKETFFRIRAYCTRDSRGEVPTEEWQLFELRGYGIPEIWCKATLLSEGAETGTEEWEFEGLALTEEESDAVPVVLAHAGFEVSHGDITVSKLEHRFGVDRESHPQKKKPGVEDPRWATHWRWVK